MPAPTEKEILTKIIESLDSDSKCNSILKFQKWFLLIMSVVFIDTTVIGYKLQLISPMWLMIISSIGGMSLMGLIMIHQLQFQTSVLKPYIDISKIKSRINL